MVFTTLTRPARFSFWRSRLALDVADSLTRLICSFFGATRIEDLDLEIDGETITATNLVTGDVEVLEHDELANSIRTYQYMHKLASASK
jgi:hypothetical protein